MSKDEQLLDLRLDALEQVGCQRVFTDKTSSSKPERPGLSEALSHLRDGDVLAVWRLDRFGRTVRGWWAGRWAQAVATLSYVALRTFVGIDPRSRSRRSPKDASA